MPELTTRPTYLVDTFIFEELLPHFGVRGGVLMFEGASTDNWQSGSPTNIIQVDQPWYIVFILRTTGLLNHLMCGQWEFKVLLEKMGKGEDVPELIKTIDFSSRPGWYFDVLTIPPGTMEEGVYRVVVAGTFKGPKNVPGPIAGFADLGLVQFYKEGK